MTRICKGTTLVPLSFRANEWPMVSPSLSAVIAKWLPPCCPTRFQCCLCSSSVSRFPQRIPPWDCHHHFGSPTRAMARSTLYVSFTALVFVSMPGSLHLLGLSPSLATPSALTDSTPLVFIVTFCSRTTLLEFSRLHFLYYSHSTFPPHLPLFYGLDLRY
ncbi:hypothetical protein H4582DRAFT_1965593 [Lactarius indigo]|nr:hypothetical protein H4582DRAFT_1965593 [Lactarius indigo]